VIVAYIDGGARGNPGPAGFGVRIEQADGTLIEEFCEAVGIATNNVAEYRALIAALEWASRNGHHSLHVRSDSQLLVQQMRGVYKVKHPGLQPLHAKARALAAEIGRVTFEHVAREQNSRADRLANMAMDGETVVSRQSSVAGPQSSVGSPQAPVANLRSPVVSLQAPVVNQQSSTDGPADPFTPVERAVRMFVYRHFVETARAPDLGAIAASVRENERTVLSALRKLVAAHALVMAPASTNIWMAHPFSAVPSAYPVQTRGRTYWANCAWDAAGMMALLGGGETRTRCPDCASPIAMEARDDRVSGEGVVHFAVPPRRFWDNVAYT
jgi:ribonuclease HI